ncbi:MAG TPA: LysR family transcriptional regulator [Propionicimonas sp.]|jgi:DNA-binding transcriptional LysR family regulator|nr:LysR family transcriptional regulator [Propionicimonas sp.]
MELHQLLLLRELADRGSITAVAEASGRTPSAVSQQLRALQRDAGRPLLVRQGRGVALTAAGRALAGATVGLATAIAEVDSSWQAWLGEPTGPVVLSVFPSVAELLLPGLLRRLREFPGIDLELVDNDVAQPEFPGLAAHADLVLAHRGEVVDARRRGSLFVQPLFAEPVDVAVPASHPLAGRGRVAAAEVVDADWLGVPAGYPLDRLLEALALVAGRPARVRWRSTDFGTLAALVGSGAGVCLLPRYCTDPARHDLVLLEVSDITLRRRVEVLARPENAARGATAAVLRALVAETGRFGG